jgi:predicted Fe-Mo cluster-binding NifX family protein
MSERIAVTISALQGVCSPMDPRFGRAAGFLVVQDGEVLAELSNRMVNAGHGAGTGAAALMGEHGVGIVISGAFGPKAHAALSALGIEMRTAPPGLSAAEALALLASGELPTPQMREFR